MNILDKYKTAYSSRYKSVSSNFTYLLVAQALNLLLPFVTYPYLIRTLGKDCYGLYVFACSIVSYYIFVVEFGFNTVVSKEIANNRDDNRRISEIVTYVFCIKFLLLLLCLLVCIALVYFIPLLHDNATLHYLCFLTCLANLFFPTWFFQGMEKLKYIAYTNSLSRGSFTILVFLLVKKQTDYLWLPVLNFSGIAIGGIICCYLLFVKYNIRFTTINTETMKYYFKRNVPFFASKLSDVVNNETNTILLGSFAGMNSVAYYDLVKKVVNIAILPFSTLNEATYPYVARTKDMRLVSKLLLAVAIGGILCYALIALFSKQVILLLAGSDLLGSQPLFFIMGLMIPLYGITFFLGYTILIVMDKSGYFNKSVILQTMVFVLLTGIFILFGIWNLYTAAAIATFCMAFQVAYRWYYVKKFSLINR